MKRSRSFALLVLGCLLLPATAAAAPGDLAGQACISNSGTEGCIPIPQPGMLTSPAGIAVDPAGTDVYVGAAGGIAHFRRAPDGSVAYVSCVDLSSSAGSFCPTEAPPGAAGALSANVILPAISPDGKQLYAVSWADALVWWDRDPVSGELSWGGCRDGAANASSNGRCGTATTFAGGNFPAGALDFSQGIAVTPDGKTIYIADQTGGLLQADRNTTSGVATPKACFDSASVTAGCTPLAADVPLASSGLDVAADSGGVYVRSISPGGISHFSRSAGGTTSFASCVTASSPSASCPTAVPTPVFNYSGSIGLAAGKLFTYGGNYATPSGTVARFGVAPGGSLGFEGCATTEAAPGPCAALPAQTAGGSIGRMALAPDGGSVYLPQGGSSERALTRLTGSLAFASCLSDTGVPACSAPPLPGPFGAPVGVTVVSPDGRQIYQTAADTLNVYEIEQRAALPVPATPAAASGPAPTALRRALAPAIRSVKRNKKGRYVVVLKVRQAGTLGARFVGRLSRKGKLRTLGKPVTVRVKRPGLRTLRLKPSAAAARRQLKAKLVVRLEATGFLAAERTRVVKLR